MFFLRDTSFRETIKSNQSYTRIVVCCLFLIFLFVSVYKLGSFPGLVGDEGYEGLSVIDHIRSDKPMVFGRESYVSFWSDYVRMPFIQWLGPTALAMRLPLLIASVATFWLAWIVLKRIWGNHLALFALVFLFFSPPYILAQRISWPIFFLPFFFFLLLFFLTGKSRFKSVFSGVVAGMGVATHMIFMAPLGGVIISYIVSQRTKFKKFLSWWPALVGFFAGFGIQLVILSTYRVESARIGSFFSIGNRLRELFLTILYYFSASSYIGEYIGEFSERNTRIILVILFLLVVCALTLRNNRKKTWLWLIGIVITLLGTTIIANYFRTRYLHIATICFWALAGIGLGKIFLVWIKNKTVIATLPIFLAIGLSLGTYLMVYRPYIATGGTAKNFPDSGDSWDSAGHFADIQPLANCLIKTKATAFAKEPKISNRLQFLRFENKQIRITSRKKGQWQISYRMGPDAENPALRRKDELCPNLRNFIVVPNDEYSPDTNSKNP